MQSQTPRKFCNHELFVWAGFVGKVIKCQLVIRTIKDCRLRHLTNCRRRDWTHAKKYIQELSTSFHLDTTALLKVILYETLVFHLKMINIYFKTALPRIMNFGLIRIIFVFSKMTNMNIIWRLKNYSNIIRGKYSNNWTELFE